MSPSLLAPLMAASIFALIPFKGVLAQGRVKDHVQLGVGARMAPGYQGSSDYRLTPLPVIDVSQGMFFANLYDGIGVRTIETNGFTLGASVAVTPGFRSKDAPNGIGKLSMGAGGRLFAAFDLGGLKLTAGGTQGFAGGSKGFVADAALAYPVALSARTTLVPAIRITWADRKHNDRYFGVSPEQSLASGLDQFDVGGGFKDISAAITANYRLSPRIGLSVSGAVTSLLGDVTKSPLVEDKTQQSGLVAITYSL